MVIGLLFCVIFVGVCIVNLCFIGCGIWFFWCCIVGFFGYKEFLKCIRRFFVWLLWLLLCLFLYLVLCMLCCLMICCCWVVLVCIGCMVGMKVVCLVWLWNCMISWSLMCCRNSSGRWLLIWWSRIVMWCVRVMSRCVSSLRYSRISWFLIWVWCIWYVSRWRCRMCNCVSRCLLCGLCFIMGWMICRRWWLVWCLSSSLWRWNSVMRRWRSVGNSIVWLLRVYWCWCSKLVGCFCSGFEWGCRYWFVFFFLF